MTKPRPPIGFATALVRIADLLGWRTMARVAGRTERTVRRWGDAEDPRCCPIDAAVLLDHAWRDAGGEGAPLLDTYRLLLGPALAPRPYPPVASLPDRVCVVFREGAQAKEALFLASLPGATRHHHLTAAREVQESIVALDATLSLLSTAALPAVPP